MKKRILTVLLVAVLSFCFLAIPAAAISTYDLSGATKTSTLTISGTKATCTSTFRDSVTYSSITAVQSLEKKGAILWSTVGGEWTKTVNNARSLSFTNTKSGLASGTYRVKTVFTAVTTSGQSETVTVYSSQVKIS